MLKSLSIENFKCFAKNTTINLNNLTLLVGGNAVGKSSVIQVLLLIKQTIEKLKNSEENINLELNNIYNLNLGDTKCITSTQNESDKILFEIEHNKNEKFFFTASKKEANLSALLSGYRVLSNLNSSSIHNNHFYYLQSQRLGFKDTQKIIEQKFFHTGYAGEYTNYVIDKLQNELVDKNRLIGDTKTLKRQIEEWLNLIVPEIEIFTEFYEKPKEVWIGIRKKSAKSDFLQASSFGVGISYVLPIIVTGLIAKKGSMFIVENPEAHLHPSAQSIIGQFLANIANSGVQIIIKTHSEHIINGVKLATINKWLANEKVIINFFSQEKSEFSPKITPITLNEKADLSELPKGFFDQQESDLAKIFLGVSFEDKN